MVRTVSVAGAGERASVFSPAPTLTAAPEMPTISYKHELIYILLNTFT